ncbi:hypothetical protein [Mucilaginibacter flavidus]|uniref:hypothetical protein n=1 Tax=Mucilaginibacter flavidus TaxID=2949309 RepID=UPI002092B5FE|nr:hypothetical protein [Mucilaginibacter flavidus]MCO5948617.1 hypothetical protein [Mucilaginibacter flavidus]
MVVEEFVFPKDESVAKLSQLAIQLRHSLTGLSKSGFKPKIDCQSGEGALGLNVKISSKKWKYNYNNGWQFQQQS